MADKTALMSSARTEWQTPPELLQIVRDFAGAGSQLALDPAAPEGSNPCRARNTISLESITTWGDDDDGMPSATRPSKRTPATDGGLAVPWNLGKGLVYVNPPYGKEIPKWVHKMATEAAAGAEIVALLPARTDTRWWHDHIGGALVHVDAVAFWKGRLRFIDPETGQPAMVWSKAQKKMVPAGAPFPSAIAYWGPHARTFRQDFASRAWVV